MAKLKESYTRRIIFSGTGAYMKFAGCLKKYTNPVDGTFYDPIRIDLLKKRWMSIKIW